jgi:UDP-N-acetylmuramate dehydrogenase
MSALGGLSVNLEPDAPLGRHTSLRVGGPARYFLASNDPEVLSHAIDAARADDVPILMLGGGSNLLVADSGFDGLVLKLATSGYSVELTDDGSPVVNAAAGATIGNLARRLAREGLAGLEWASTVPGSVGGAVVNNAGAFGGCTADCLIDADLLMPGRGVRVVPVGELGYGYRTSALKRCELGAALVVSARFALRRDEPGAILTRISEQQDRRTATQPRQLSAGSIFANPPGDHAGRLIEEVGLKGQRRGGAEISGLHANFIVNTGAATAANVYDLIRLAQDTVWDRSGIWLHPEVQLVGAWYDVQIAALAGPTEAVPR